MAIVTFTRTDIEALAARLDRHSIAINIPHSMAGDMRDASLLLRFCLSSGMATQPIRIENSNGQG
jgi:hypothetical protein